MCFFELLSETNTFSKNYSPTVKVDEETTFLGVEEEKQKYHFSALDINNHCTKN